MGMIDIVIPYRLDAHNGLELLYALRSIEKYLTGYRDIYLIGDKPDWLTAVKHIPFTDAKGRKEFNIYQKLLRACQEESVSDNFIYVNDDHFLLKPLDVKDFKYWYDEPLKKLLDRNPKGYAGTIYNTLEIYPEALNFDIHTPIIFNKALFGSLFSSQQKEICVKSMYCNSPFVEGEKEQMPDLKLNMPHYKGKIEAKIKGRLFFSTGPLVIHDEMIQVWNELYPEKSKYEI